MRPVAIPPRAAGGETQALNPRVDWQAVEEAYLGNKPVEITYVDNFLTEQALSILLDMARGSSIFVDNRQEGGKDRENGAGYRKQGRADRRQWTTTTDRGYGNEKVRVGRLRCGQI